MKRHAALPALLILCALSSSTHSQSSPLSSRLELQFRNRMLAGVVLPDSHEVLLPRGRIGVSDHTVLEPAPRPISSLSMTAYPLRLYGLEPYELSRMDCIAQGADMGMTMGMFVGALGSATGIWDDENAWYIAGAMAAVGAMLGGTSWAKDPRWRIRYRWEE